MGKKKLALFLLSLLVLPLPLLVRFAGWSELEAPFMLYALPATTAAAFWGKRGGLAAGGIAAALTLLALIRELHTHRVYDAADMLVLAAVLLIAPFGTGLILDRERRARGFYAGLVEALREGVVVVEPNLRISFCNCAAQQNFSFLGLCQGRPLAEVFPSDVVAACRQALAEAATPHLVEARFNIEGKERMLWVHIYPYQLPGSRQTTFLTLLISDVTGRWLRFRHLQTLSYSDELTGLGNYRFFRERLGENLALAARHGEPLALAILDLDNFKAINDTYGHLAGNCVLQEVARTLRRVTRESDILARFGGDEFAWIMPLTICEQAKVAVERFRLALHQRRIAIGDGTTVTVRASVGLACYPEDGRTVEELISAADSRMYKEKEAAAAAE